MIRNYNLLSGSRDTRLKNKNVIDVDISPTSFASKKGKFSFGLVGLFLLMMSFASFAQVSSNVNPTYGYIFTSNPSGTYTPLTGGTVFQSGAAINTDTVLSAVALPFTFTFNGGKHTAVNISNNGFITFGIAPGVANYLPISTTTAANLIGYDGCVAGFAHNLVAAAAGTPEISYGTNGSGDFVVQYQDVAITAFASTRATFQIILKADGKTIQTVYGPNNTGQASVTGAQVGLRGTHNTDYNNRTLTSGGNWNTAGGATGTANTSAMTYTAASTMPASGLTFQWAANAYTPTYLATPFSTVQDFTTWTAGSGPNNVPSTNFATNGYGQASWQIDNCPLTTTTTGWTSTSGAYTPADYAAAVGGRSARFHSFNASVATVGNLDYYVDLSGGLGALNLTFNTINTSGTDVLRVFLSTDGGVTFTQVGSTIGVNATWTAQSISLGAVTSATSVIRFRATSDFGSTDIGLDNVAILQPPVTPPSCATALLPADLATGVGRNAVLTWAAATGFPLSYDVYFGTAPGAPLVTNTTSLTYNPGLLAATTTYYWKIVPKNGNGDAVGCVEQSFTTGTGFTYCLPSDTSGCASGDTVTSVALGTLSDPGQTCTPQYADRSGVQNAIPDLGQSTTVSVTLTFGTDSTQYSAVWVDFNQNGVFETTEFFSLGTAIGASGTTAIPITVPGGALLGNTKMRVRGGQDSALTSAHACGSSTSNFGTSRDYTVNITAPPACIPPSALNASAVTTTGANLDWTCASCTGTFRVEYNTTPATFGGVGNVVIDPATSGVATGTLLPGTAYTFFVRQDCGGGSFSTVSSGSFTTPFPGETCVDAATVTVYPDSVSAVNTLLTTGASSDGPNATCSLGGGNTSKRDRWVKFVAPTNGNKVVIKTVSGTLTDMVMQVWSACPATGTALGCSDDVNGLMPQLDLCQNVYVGGETYYVQLFPYSDLAGDYNIQIYEEAACPIPPDNDECAGTIDIEVGLPGSCPTNATFGTTINATATAGVVKTDCDLFGTYLDVMYKFNTGSATEINFDFTNITGTNEFGLYDGCGTTYLGICENGSLSTIITGLDANTDYWIIVWANNAGAQGNFSICLSALAAPVCLTSPIAPANGATNINACVPTELSWNEVPDALTYDVFFDAGAGPATTLVSDDQAAFLGTNTYDVVGLLTPGTSYSWRVIGKNSSGEPTGCSDFTFTTAGATVPGCVASPTAPAIASIICPGSTTFSWPAVATATTYDVYVDTVLVSDDQTGLTYTMDVSTLGSHTWMIVPANCVGEAVGCSIFTFSNTGGAAPSCVAAPTSPVDASNTCSGNIYLAWPAAAGATSYDVYLNTVLVADNTTNLYYIAGVLAAGAHSWQIVPSNCYGDASGCATWTFTVGTGTAPAGDTFATAIDLGAITSTASVNGNNFVANCWNNDFNTTSTPVGVRPGNDVFYKFEVTCAGTLDFGTCSTSFDTYVSLLDSTGTLITADDDSCTTPNTAGSLRTGVAVTPGIYYIVVDAYWASTETTLVSQGTFTLDISTTPTTSCSTVVNLKLFIEGYYIGGGAMTTVEDNQNFLTPTTTNVETITVELHDAASPYAMVATANAMLHTDGTATATFTSGPSGSYYIAVKSRNVVQTWSALPVTVGGTPITYNFTDASGKAYGDNMIMIETGVYALFSGDLDANDFVDGSDYSVWESDYNAFNNGVFATDLNGDGFVDGSDYSIWEGNYNQFIFASYPF